MIEELSFYLMGGPNLAYIKFEMGVPRPKSKLFELRVKLRKCSNIMIARSSIIPFKNYWVSRQQVSLATCYHFQNYQLTFDALKIDKQTSEFLREIMGGRIGMLRLNNYSSSCELALQTFKEIKIRRLHCLDNELSIYGA